MNRSVIKVALMSALICSLFFLPEAQSSVARTNSSPRHTLPASETSVAESDSASVTTASLTTTYRITFEATWSSQTHPHPSFPSNPHFSSLIGAVHTDTVTFWKQDGVAVASPGIEQMAETGGTSLLMGEIQAQVPNNATSILTRPGSFTSPGSATTDSFEIGKDFPLVTLVSMVAPSPDWFVGVSSLSLLKDNGQWVSTKTVQLYPYDAGTDSGIDYTSSNADVTPHMPITNISNQFPFSDQPLGTLTFTRLETDLQVYLPILLSDD
jgi:hypothetical protein